MQQYTVRTFIILIVVKSLGFGSNFRYYTVILTLGLSTHASYARLHLMLTW